MPQNTLETVNELIAGSFGGAAQVLVGQPLDTIKTRAQIAPSSVSFLSFHGLLTQDSSCINRYHRGHVC
jgi:Mitochondrial carrier protein